MAAPQAFRSAFNGFNREDVAHYLEYINTKYKNQIDQLTAENQELQAAAQRRPLVDQDDLREYLQSQPSEELDAANTRCAELTALLEAEKARCQELAQLLEEEKSRSEVLTQQLEAARQENAAQQAPAVPVPPTPADTLSSLAAEELEAYRRAERLEREAKERAELIYMQVNGVLTEASSKVDSITSDIGSMADQVMRQLTQLQIAVNSSKQTLQEASSIMNTLRPMK